MFALANAGVNFTSGGGPGLGGPVMRGVLLGLLVGKPLGVLLASWAVLKSGVAALPQGSTWRQVVGVAVLCGIGFRMSLFVANLAFADRGELLASAKVGILIASAASGVAGGAIIASAKRPRGQGAMIA